MNVYIKNQILMSVIKGIRVYYILYFFYVNSIKFLCILRKCINGY